MGGDDPRTLFKVRVPKDKAVRDLAGLLAFFIAFFTLLSAFGALQVYMCREKAPSKPVMECLRFGR